jgi:hypothetical protein
MGTLSGGAITATVRLELVETAFGTGSVVTGTYSSSDPIGASAGALTGSVSGASIDNRVTLTLKPTRPPACGATQALPAGDVLLTLTRDGTRLSGDGVVVLCGAEARAAVQLAK